MNDRETGKWIAGLVGILLAVMGFFFQVQLKTSERVGRLETKTAVVETDVRYIRAAVERIEKRSRVLASAEAIFRAGEAE